MGLTITAYQNIEKADESEDYNFKAYNIDSNWNYKLGELESGAYYLGDAMAVHNCAYSTHNRFREYLLQVIGREDLLNNDGRIDWYHLKEGIPFYEFIDFADNEGCLGWKVSQRLYADFVEWNSKAKEFLSEYYYSLYKGWTEIFSLAKDKGAVVFS